MRDFIRQLLQPYGYNKKQAEKLIARTNLQFIAPPPPPSPYELLVKDLFEMHLYWKRKGFPDYAAMYAKLLSKAMLEKPAGENLNPNYKNLSK